MPKAICIFPKLAHRPTKAHWNTKSTLFSSLSYQNMKYVKITGGSKLWIRGNTATKGSHSPAHYKSSHCSTTHHALLLTFLQVRSKTLIRLRHTASNPTKHNGSHIFTESSHFSSISASLFELRPFQLQSFAKRNTQTWAAQYFWPQTRSCPLKMCWLSLASLVSD